MKFYFSHTIKKRNREVRQISQKKITYPNKIKWNKNSPESMKLNFYFTFIKTLINFVVTSQDKWAHGQQSNSRTSHLEWY